MVPGHAPYHSHDVANLLPKYRDPDPDIRFMSLNDLHTIVSGNTSGTLDYTTAAKTVDALIELLDDRNGDVQGQAIKCVGPLARLAPTEILPPFIDRIINMKLPNSKDGSIPPSAIRALINHFPEPANSASSSSAHREAYKAVSKVLLPRLLPTTSSAKATPNITINVADSNGPSADCIDLLNEIVTVFGPLLQDNIKDALSNCYLDILGSERGGSIVKKKAVQGLAALAVNYPASSFRSLAERVESRLIRAGSHLSSIQKFYLTLVGSLSRAIPLSIGPYLSNFVPFVLEPLSQENLDLSLEDFAENGHVEEAKEEIKEAALIALDDIVSSNSKLIKSATMQDIVGAAVRYSRYDTSRVMDDDDEDMETEEENDPLELEDEDFEEEDAASDADNPSWKLRRCAAKLLYSIVSVADSTRADKLFEKVAPALIKALGDREENVRLEFAYGMRLLIEKIGQLAPSLPRDRGPTMNSKKRRRESSGANKASPNSAEGTSPTSLTLANLAKASPSIVSAGLKMLQHSTSIPTKQAGTDLLKDLANVRPGSLSTDIGPIMAAVTNNLKIESSKQAHSIASGPTSATTLHLRSLSLISTICDTHNDLRSLGSVISAVLPLVDDTAIGIAIEALKALESLVKAVIAAEQENADAEQARYVNIIFDVSLTSAKSYSNDLEVKKQALHTLGATMKQTAHVAGSLPSSKRDDGIDCLVMRLKNETTRVASIDALAMVFSSMQVGDKINAQPIDEAAVELANQLRKADRTLRTSAMSTLQRLCGNEATVSCISPESISTIAKLVVPCIDSLNPEMLNQALSVLSDLVHRHHAVAAGSNLNAILCNLIQAGISGAILENFLRLVAAIGSEHESKALMQQLLQLGVSGDPLVIGAAIGTLIATAGSDAGVTVTQIQNELKTGEVDNKCLALSVLGEVVRRKGPSAGIQPEIFLHALTAGSDKTARAAGTALGRASVANISVYVPRLLEAVQSPTVKEVIRLYAVKEMLQEALRARIDLGKYLDDCWDFVFSTSGNEDTQALAAECVGRITTLEPVKYLPQLKMNLANSLEGSRALVIQGLRFAFTDSDELFNRTVRPMLKDLLLAALADPVVTNRRLAFVTVNAVANNQISMLLSILSDLRSLLFDEAMIKPELIREVAMGPFKHRIDDGLENRKVRLPNPGSLTHYSLYMPTSKKLLHRTNHYCRLCTRRSTGLLTLHSRS